MKSKKKALDKARKDKTCFVCRQIDQNLIRLTLRLHFVRKTKIKSMEKKKYILGKKQGDT